MRSKFLAISYLPNLKFDLIVSNPPQMPMSNPGQSHDYGGIDGRDIILNIIKKSYRYLNHNGKIVFLCFDFLGATERFNSNPSIAEIAEESGFRYEVTEKHKRYIRKGGKTEENLKWIQRIYPLYTFKKTPAGNYFHEILILELNKT